jgi:hypothetical protein
MDITLLIRRALKKEGGKQEVNEPQARDFTKALHEQLLDDSDGKFNLYDNLHALKEVPESEDSETTG